jgi:predicted small metal-binding protein
MSVLEKKALAFEKLAALQSEEVIDEILAHLEKLNNETNVKPYVIQHAISIMNERSAVLDKLAK